jgi:hypothetical protein
MIAKTKEGSFGICCMEYDPKSNQIYLKLIRHNQVYFTSVIRAAHQKFAYEFISDATENEISDLYQNNMVIV